MIYGTNIYENNVDQGEKVLILRWLINHLPGLKINRIDATQIYCCLPLWTQNENP